MSQKEEILKNKNFEKLELELDLRKTLGYVFKFPLNVLDKKSILALDESILKIEKLKNDTEKGSEFINQTRFLIMQDCIRHYKDDQSEEGNFIREKFIDKYYDPFNPEKAVEHFKHLCYFTADEVTKINNYYYSYLLERSEKMKGLEEEQQTEMKHLEKEKPSKEEKKEKIEELEQKYNDLILRVEEELKEKYEVES